MSAYSQKRTLEYPATSVGAIPLDCYYSSWGLPVSKEGVERRLTTILAADVVGYSRLMAADEARALTRNPRPMTYPELLGAPRIPAPD